MTEAMGHGDSWVKRSGREDTQSHRDPWGTKRQGHPYMSQRHRQDRRQNKTQRPGLERSAKQMETERLRRREMGEGRNAKERPRETHEMDENKERKGIADSSSDRKGKGVGAGLAPAPGCAHLGPDWWPSSKGCPCSPQPEAAPAFVLRRERAAVGRERPLPPLEGRAAESTQQPASRPRAALQRPAETETQRQVRGEPKPASARARAEIQACGCGPPS